MAHDVFISYSSKDKTAADAACAFLESKGIRCWMAPRDVVPGLEWGAAVVQAISQSKLLLLIFSANSNASPQIVREVERAVSRGLPIIPMRIEDVKPTHSLEYFINTPHWLDAFTPPLQLHLAYLSDVIAHLLGSEAERTARTPRLAPDIRRPARRKWVILAACAAVIALFAIAYVIFASRNSGGEFANAPQCLVKVPSLPDPNVCSHLVATNADWQDCSSNFAEGDMAAREQRAQQLVAAGRPASSFYYDNKFASGAYGSISHYWEMFGQCVSEKHLPFDKVSSGINFPEEFWNKTRRLREIFLQNWKGPNQPLPDFMSNFHDLCTLYKQKRMELHGANGSELDCTL